MVFAVLLLMFHPSSRRRTLRDYVGLSAVRSVCDYDYVQDYCKSNQPISLKLGDMIGPNKRKNILTFGGDPVPDTDSGSLSISVAIAE